MKLQANAWARGNLSAYLRMHPDEHIFESLRLYAVCKEFHVLPASGGVYDQDPTLLQEWNIISGIVGEVLEEQNQSTATKSTSQKTSNGLQFKRVPKVPSVFKRYIKK